MKIAHFANWAPSQSGMYESTKDQIKYERKEGLTSDFIDVHHETSSSDRIDDWLKPASWDEAVKADIWVLHSLIPEKIKYLFDKKVTVAILHGPAFHMLMKEWTTNRKTQSFNLHISILWQYDATIAFDPDQYYIMKLYDEHDRLHFIRNSVDLERYAEPNVKWEYKNHPAIISADINRLEKLPAQILWSMPEIVKKIPSARLNLFGLSLEPIGTWRNILCRAKKRALEAMCENIQLESTTVAPFMAGADIGFNNNISGIASRVTMEMMAMGLPVISFGGEYTKYVARIWDFQSIATQVQKCWKDLQKNEKKLKKQIKAYAKEHFNRETQVKKYVELYKQLMEKKYG